MVCQYTHISPNGKENILDLIYTSHPTDFASCSVTKTTPPLSDHHIVETLYKTNLKLQPRGPQNIIIRPPFHLYDFRNLSKKDEFIKLLEDTNWQHSTKLWGKIIEYGITCDVKRHAPNKHNKIHYLENVIKFLSAKFRKFNSLKDHPKTTNDTVIANTAMYSARINATHDKLRTLQENHVLSELTNNKNIPLLMKYARSKSKHKEPVGPLKHNESHTDDPTVMSNICAKQFKSVFTSKSNKPESIDFPTQNVEPLTDVEITAEKILESINQLNETSASGPDCAPASFLHEYGKQLAVPLKYLWEASINNATMPYKNTLSLITPLHKGDARDLAKNYRPISLTNHVDKVFERIIKTAITNHLNQHQLIPKSQHGFRERHSTITQLLAHLDSVLSKLVKGHKAVETVILDFAKAFDKVDHSILLMKLKRLDIQGKVLDWIKAFLSDRHNQVIIENCLSEPYIATSGVPQGFVLGPLLFLVMISDLPSKVRDDIEMFLFADDVKLSKPYNSGQSMQSNLDECYKWSEVNKLPLNYDKLYHITFSTHPDPLKHSYTTPNGNTIKQVEEIKDLGITFAANLTFDRHTELTVAKVNSSTHFFLRLFRSREVLHMKRLFQYLCKLKLIYASVVWSPGKANLTAIESTLRKFTSRLTGLSTLNYWERLEKLKLLSMERSYERFIIITTYKIITGLNTTYFENDFHTDNPRTGIKVGNPGVKSCNAKASALRENLFRGKARTLWNCLPLEILNLARTDTPSPELASSFKRKIDKFLKLIPDKPGNVKGENCGQSSTSSLTITNSIPDYLDQDTSIIGKWREQNKPKSTGGNPSSVSKHKVMTRPKTTNNPPNHTPLTTYTSKKQTHRHHTSRPLSLTQPTPGSDLDSIASPNPPTGNSPARKVKCKDPWCLTPTGPK